MTCLTMLRGSAWVNSCQLAWARFVDFVQLHDRFSFQCPFLLTWHPFWLIPFSVDQISVKRSFTVSRLINFWNKIGMWKMLNVNTLSKLLRTFWRLWYAIISIFLKSRKRHLKYNRFIPKHPMFINCSNVMKYVF